MFNEIEIKLRVSPATLERLRQHPLLKKRNKSGWQHSELLNQYYDTPKRELAQSKVALRVRKDGEQFIQTLKTRGQSVAGLSERHEWDWPLSSNALDHSKLDDSCWPQELAKLDKSKLAPLFTTNFMRDKAELAWGRGKQKAVVEAALDQGQVVAGEQQEPICELELELRQGEPSALLELACELAADVALMPCDISKAERGYRLFDADSYTLRLPQAQLSSTQTLDEVFAALGWQLLGSSQRLAEQYRFNGHWKLLEQWVEQLLQLRALLSSPGQATPRSSTRALRLTLDALLDIWQPRAVAGYSEQAVRDAAPAQFAAELEQCRWGQLSLNLAHLLITRGWQSERNDKGNKLGQVAFGNWLLHQLKDDAQGLSKALMLAEQDPACIREHTPRLSRLCLWLEHARQLTELSEVDRFYGELNKLRYFAQATTEDSLAACSHQAHTVRTLKAWRELTR
ncbi:CYTH domain-containing protein [Atopomonas sediminilitoris]|uniref:CYTH domain-containing protein n=1 Tax=Atopomonas sediminilitoris TaxID=2919919 RepID=UPI001F4ED901|nr:inorganic triphosphatase [Atopomonas sediminilitoris]MCJ8168317.1 inorganic triphosphatase [Atopomonas sediminilitoris]